MSKAHNPLHILTTVPTTETITTEAPTTKVTTIEDTTTEATTTEVPTTEATTTEVTTNEATVAETETTKVPTPEATTIEETTTGAPTTEVPTTEALTTTVDFSLNGITYPNGSTVLRGDIGEGDNALLCTTDREDCCNNFLYRAGQFYFPDGSQVPVQGDASSGYYRNRGIQLIRLNRQSNGILTGQFRCEIPSSIDVNTVLYINIGTNTTNNAVLGM